MPFVSQVKLVREHRSMDGSVTITMEEWVVSDQVVDGTTDTDNMRLFATLSELLRPHTLASKVKEE